MQFYENPNTSHKHILQKIQKKYNLKVKNQHYAFSAEKKNLSIKNLSKLSAKTTLLFVHI